ncbi:hypothetical protein [Arthrobacter sp. NA-172]|uniref:hypothetical protein n=1 Tax=Arthrobacter sp. NA-172 TaxID=3367524 RepID=UPI003754F6AC
MTASVASWLVEQVSSGAAAAATVAEEPMKREIRRLAEQVERLTTLLEASDGGTGQSAEVQAPPATGTAD